MAYPSKPTGNNIIPESTIFASSNASKQAMTTSEVLNGYNNDGETATPLTSIPDANRFNNFLYQVHNTTAWIIKYIEELYADKFSKSGGTITGNVTIGSGAKISGIATPTQNSDAVPKSYIDSALAGAMWIGEIKAMAYPNIPTLPSGVEVVPCDGRAISRTTYSTLFQLIGTQFGVGDGTTTFNIPDYRGLFLRGWDGNSNRDPGRSYGSIQNGGAPSHTHTFSGTTGNESTNHTHTRGTMNITGGHSVGTYQRDGSGCFSTWANGSPEGADTRNGTYVSFDASRNWTGSTSGVSSAHTHAYSGTTSGASSNVYQNISEVRPINSTCYYLMRIK